MISLNVVADTVKSAIASAVVSTGNAVLNAVETVSREVQAAYNSELSYAEHLNNRAFVVIKDTVKDRLFYGNDEEEIMILKFLTSIVDLIFYCDQAMAVIQGDPDAARQASLEKDLDLRMQINVIIETAIQELNEERNERLALFEEQQNELPLIKELMRVVGDFIY